MTTNFKIEKCNQLIVILATHNYDIRYKDIQGIFMSYNE